MELKNEIKKKFEESLNTTKYYKHSSHATYNLTWHCVWITKYRRKVITDEMKIRLETIIRWVCRENYVIVLSLGFEKDHVHCLLSFPITVYVPNMFKYLKWRTSKVIREEFWKYLRKHYRWRNKSLWAVWYFFCSVWRVDEDTIKKYVENQWREDARGEEITII